VSKSALLHTSCDLQPTCTSTIHKHHTTNRFLELYENIDIKKCCFRTSFRCQESIEVRIIFEKFVNQWINPRFRTLYMNTMIKADAATLKAASNFYTTAISGITFVSDLLGSITLQPYPLSLLNKQAPNGGNVLGLDPSSGPLVSILLLTYWSSASDDALVYSTMKGVIDKINTDASSRGTLVPFKFMNYATATDDVISSYGAANKAKLQKASKKYDPLGLFQMGVPGGFKLFK
jgi:hypothetical protein